MTYVPLHGRHGPATAAAATATAARVASSEPGRHRRAAPFIVFVSLFALYLVTAAGHIETIDYSESLAVAQQIVLHGVVWITGFPTTPGGGAVTGVGGHIYAPHDLGLALLLVPLVALVHWFSWSATLATFLYASLDALLGAVLVTVFFLFARALTGRDKVAAWSSAIVGVGTLVFPYTHCTFDAMPTALFLLTSTYFAWRAEREGRPLLLVFGGLCSGGAILVRIDSAFVVAALTVWVLVRGLRPDTWQATLRTTDWWRDTVAWLVPLVVAGAITAWYDTVRFGSIFNDGHAHDPQTRAITPLPYGVAANLFSPGKGLIFFAPPVLLAILAWRLMWHSQRGLLLATVGGFALYAVFISRLANWSGQEAWGPRFLLPTLPLLMLGLPILLDRWPDLAIGTRIAVVVLSAVGVVVQVGGVLVWEATISRLHGGALQQQAFHDSEIWYSWRLVWKGLRGIQPVPSVPQGGIVNPPVPRFDVWWLGGWTQAHFHHLAYLVTAAALLVIAALGAGLLAYLLHADSSDERRPARG